MTKRYRIKVVHISYTGQDKQGNEVIGEATLKIKNKKMISESDLKHYREWIIDKKDLRNITIDSFKHIR